MYLRDQLHLKKAKNTNEKGFSFDFEYLQKLVFVATGLVVGFLLGRANNNFQIAVGGRRLFILFHYSGRAKTPWLIRKGNFDYARAQTPWLILIP